MKTLAEIQKTIDAFEKKYKVSVMDAPQGSNAWFLMKLGVVSASNASKAVAAKTTETRLTYMSELVAQVCTGIFEEISSKHMDWGNQHEDAARANYEFSTDQTVTPISFVFRDDRFREGCSADGLVTATKGVEFKCPYNTGNYIKFLCEDKIKSEYVWQYQYTLRVLDADEWDFVNYDPRMKKKPMHILNVKRDAEKQKQFDDLIPAFIEDMGKMLLKVGIKFGDQWVNNPLFMPQIAEVAG